MNKLKPLIKIAGLAVLFFIAALPAFSFEVSVEAEETVDISVDDIHYQYGAIDVSHETEYIDFFWSFSVCNDGKYQPSHGEEFYFGYYFYMENAGISINYEDLGLTAGRTTLTDQVDSPYSLFVSSKIIPALLTDFSYDDGNFFFTSRWTELNRNSALTVDLLAGNEPWPDRGWQYNTYGIYLGDFTLGFQDSLIYTGRSFDAEYFLNPLPGFIKQYTRISAGKPWQVDGDDNSIMGFFVEYRPDRLYSYFQVLIDDFNANSILNPDSSQNPNKIAWSIGGNYGFDFGIIGFYHAGATKYTFQSSGASSVDYLYGYSFYQTVTYSANGVIKPIELEDTYIGYYNGENNISFLVDFTTDIKDIGLYTSLEFSLSGDKSPANAWDQYSWWAQEEDAGTKLLDSDVLEKKLVLTAGASRALPELGLPDLKVSAALELGYIWNVLELAETESDDVNQTEFWSPSDNNQAVFSLSIGAIYTF